MPIEREFSAVQYALALSVGQKLQLRPMLRIFVPDCLRMLNGTEGHVWFQDDKQAELDNPLFSYPKIRIPFSEKYPELKEDIAKNLNSQWLENHYTAVVPADGFFFHFFSLGGKGLFVLRRKFPLDEDQMLALEPVCGRLATACLACFEHEALLTAQQQAEQANKAKTEFLARMSHELRTPLHGVLGLTSLTLDTQLNETQRNNLTSVKSSATGLLSLIDEILDISKIEARELKLNEAPFQITPFIDNLIRPLRHMAEEKGLKLCVKLNVKNDWSIQSDSSRIKQVLNNLISNAIKFTNTGLIYVKVHLEKKPNSKAKVTFLVQDSGIGISLEHQRSIFDPFTQADGANNRQFGGTGLGLAISSNIVSLMGGTLEVKSEQGKGSLFSFSIEASTSTSKKSDERSSAISKVPNEPHNILLVEDNEVNKLLAKTILESAGHTVRVAENGLESLDLWRGEKPDLIFMDVQMPIMDGLEATRKIRLEEKITNADKTPIVALSANARDEDQKACLNVGMDCFVAKPFTKDTLLKVIESYT